VRALTSLLGASAFLGEALVAHPDLADRSPGWACFRAGLWPGFRVG